MKTILETPFGYYTYNLDALWFGLYQMGNEVVEEN